MKRAFKNIRLSVVIPVKDSHPIVRRQLVHFNKMNLTDDIEVIMIDDNSNPPLRATFSRYLNDNIQIYASGDTRDWTIACARNLGIRIARGKYIFCTDIDHIISKELMADAYKFNGDRLEFRREWGVLDNRGNIRQDKEILFKYGMSPKTYKKHGVRRYYHVGTVVMRKQIIEDLDGYPVKCCERGAYPTKEDRLFYHRWLNHMKKGLSKPAEKSESVIYCFPGTPWNHKNMFHGLDRGKYGDPERYGIQKT